MRHKNTKYLLAAAALAALPSTASHAATITYAYDNVLFGTSPTAITSAAGAIAGTSVTYVNGSAVVTVPVGDYVSYGVQVEVTNNGGSGLAAFDLGFNNSNPASSTIYTNASVPAGSTLKSYGNNPTINAVYSLTKFSGDYDGSGGIQGTAVGAMAGVIQATQATNAQSLNAAGAFAQAFTGLKVLASGAGVTTFTPIQVNSGTSIFTQNSLGTSAAQTNAYSTRAFSAATDTVSVLPTLTITAGSVSTTPTKHPIVSLAPAGTPTYGSQLGSITVVSTGPGGYVPGSTSFASATTGYVVTSTFNVGDQEVYALKLDSNGVAIPTSSTLNATIVADINALGTGSNVSAGLVSGSAYAGLFPGYDILLTSTAGYAGPASDDLDIDFSQDTDTATPGLTVVGAAAVPEPATAAGAVIGAAGLLLGRRKSKKLA
jgi:hypothetical protein